MKKAVADDERYVHLLCSRGIKEAYIPGWLDAFNRMLLFKNHTLITESEYRTYFANWLMKVPNATTMHPEQYSPINHLYKPNIPASPINSGDEKLKRLLGKV